MENLDGSVWMYEATATGPFGPVVTGVDCWLEWSEGSYSSGEHTLSSFLPVGLKVFHLFEVFVYQASYRAGGPTYPRAAFLALWPSQEGRFREAYAKAKKFYLDGESSLIVPRERVPMLAAERDALEKQISAIGQILASMAQRIEWVLKAWFALALQDLEAHVEPEAQFRHKMELLNRVSAVWDLSRQGASLDKPFKVREGLQAPTLRFWIDELRAFTHVDKRVAEAQYAGCMHHMTDREALLEVASDFNERRRALEYILRHALVGAPLLLDADADTRQEEERTRWHKDGRSKGKQFEHEMVACYWAFRDSPGSEGMGNPKVRGKVLTMYNNPIGDRQFQSYITDNKPQLTPEQIAKYLKDLKEYWGSMLRA